MALRVLPRKAWRDWRRSDDLRIPLHPAEAEDASRRSLPYGVRPLWVVPGPAAHFGFSAVSRAAVT
ncbi:hypothetical protein ACGFZQ_42140 [Streptomyces sp. NPDC048254]|uniref:hypothetical protein n=1 Tax=Streptomyces sp. NPDC048254 TaxID=3365525 RepID=UPI003717B6BA